MGIGPALSESFNHDKCVLGFIAYCIDVKTKPKMAEPYNGFIEKGPIVPREGIFVWDDLDIRSLFDQTWQIEPMRNDLLATNII